MKVTLGEVRGYGVYKCGRFSNPDVTSDGRLPRRVHFYVSAHNNTNLKYTCLDREFNLGKLALGRLRSEILVWLFSV
jgi:hypothetical protein